MNFLKQEAADIHRIFREKELISSQKALERAWTRFGGKYGKEVDSLNLQGLVKRARRAVTYQLTYPTASFDPDFESLLYTEHNYLKFTKDLKDPGQPDASAYTESWLKLHWQICDLFMRTEGLEPEDSPFETFLPSTIPQDFVNFHNLSPIEAFRRRIAIKNHLGLLKLRSNVLPEHLR